MIEITNNEQFEQFINSNLQVVIDFNADWCGPCRMLKPILDSLCMEYKIGSINIDKMESLARTYGIMSIPCLVKFINGKEESRMIGLHSKGEVEDFLK